MLISASSPRNHMRISSQASRLPQLPVYKTDTFQAQRSDLLRFGGAQEDFFKAVKDGDLEAMRSAKKQGVDPFDLDSQGFPAIYLAAWNNRTNIIEELFSYKEWFKGDSSKTTQKGNTAIHAAASQGHLEALKLLLDHSLADINTANQSGATPLSSAAIKGHTAVVKSLIERGVDLANVPAILDQVRSAGHMDTATFLEKEYKLNKKLHDAVKSGNVRGIRQAMEQGANVNSKVYDSAPAIYLAALHNQTNSIEELLRYNKDCIEDTTPDGDTAVFAAVDRGNVDALKLLVEHGAKLNPDYREVEQETTTIYGYGEDIYHREEKIIPFYGVQVSPLYLAATKGHLEIVKYLINQPIDIEDMQSAESLARIGVHGSTKEQRGEVERLLSNSFKVNKELLDSVKSNDISGVRHAIDNGANVNSRFCEKSPLGLAVVAPRPNYALIKLLLKKGADPNKKENESRHSSPFQQACRKRELNTVKLLVEHGANIESLGQNELLDLADKDWRSGGLKVMKFLKGKGQNFKRVDYMGQTIFHKAASSDYYSKALKPLLELGGPELLNKRDKLGRTPFYVACENGDYKTLKELAQLNANALIADNEGITPLQKIERLSREATPWQKISGRGEPKAVDLVRNLVQKQMREYSNKSGHQPVHQLSQFAQEQLNRELHAVIEVGGCAAIESLFKEGADLNAPGEDGRTPLRRARDCQNKKAEELLLKLGADPKTLTQPVEQQGHGHFRFDDLPHHNQTKSRREGRDGTATETQPETASLVSDSPWAKTDTMSSTGAEESHKRSSRHSDAASISDTASLVSDSVWSRTSASSTGTARHRTPD